MPKLLKKIPRTTQNILAAGLLAGLAAAGILAALRVWPFGDGSLLTGDLNGMYLNFFADLKDRFWSGGFFYSLRKMAGGSTLGLFAYYMASPLNLLYILLPKAAYSDITSFLFVLRAALASAALCFFLQRHLGAASRVFIGAGPAFALCAFFIVYNQNVIWMDAVIMLPLVLWGLDVLIRERRVLPFTLLLAATIVLNFYTAFSICIFAVLYFVYGWLRQNGHPGQSGPAAFLRAGARLAGGGVLAAGLAMALLLPALYEVLAGGDMGTAGLTLEPNFALYRLPERLFPGTFFWGDVRDGLPNLYCGLAAMMLAGAYFAARRVPLKEKLAAGGILAVLVLSMWLQGPDLVWQGFKPPTFFPHRYSFVFSFFLLLLACRAALLVFTAPPAAQAGGVAAGAGSGHTGKAGKAARLSPSARIALGLVAGGAVFIVYTVAIARGNIISLPKIAQAAAAVLGTGAAVWLHGQGRPALRRAAVALLCLVMVADVSANALLSIRKFEYYPRSGFVTYTQGATATVAALKERDPGLYRVETANSRTQNDPMLVGSMGISHYSSLMPDGVPRLRERLGYVNYSIYGWGSTAFADSLLGIRYLYDQGGARALPAHWQPLALDTPLAAYENPYAFPLAYTAPEGVMDLPLDDYKADTFALQNAIAQSLVPAGAPPLVPAEFTARAGEILTATATMPVAGPLYLALPYAGQWTGDLLVNGQKVASYFDADTLGGVVGLGTLAAGDTVDIALHIPATEADAESLRLYALDEAAMAALAATVNQNAAANLEMLDGGHIRCTATAETEGQVLVLSVAWQENWHATVNGQPVQPLSLLGGLTAIPLPAGESAVELRFQHPGVWPGLAVTLASAALLALWVALARRRQKRAARS